MAVEILRVCNFSPQKSDIIMTRSTRKFLYYLTVSTDVPNCSRLSWFLQCPRSGGVAPPTQWGWRLIQTTSSHTDGPHCECVHVCVAVKLMCVCGWRRGKRVCMCVVHIAWEIWKNSIQYTMGMPTTFFGVCACLCVCMEGAGFWVTCGKRSFSIPRFDNCTNAPFVGCVLRQSVWMF